MTPLQELTNKIHTLVPETMEEDKSGVSFQRRFDRNIEWAFRAINDDGEDINDTLNILRTNLLALHDKAITEARQDWLRSEIEKLESLTGISRNPDFYLELQRRLDGNIAMKDIDNFQLTQIAWEAKDLVLTSIITRYKNELSELEKGQ